MSLRICGSCANHILVSDLTCPHCGAKSAAEPSPTSLLTPGRKTSRVSVATALLFGLSLTACGEKEDTSSEPAAEPSEPAVEPAGEPEYGVPDTGFEADYGVPMIDNDADGFYEDEDCNDNSAATFPGAGTNEADPAACMTDADGDGYGAISPESGAVAGTDCNDGDASINPAAAEVPGNDTDENCDGATD